VERRKAEALSLEKRIKDYESRSSRTLTERAAAQQKVRISFFHL
jgi:predicted GIY-YIG superfamily endonuclease